MTQLSKVVDNDCQIVYIDIDTSQLNFGGGIMKNRDKFCDEFDKLNRELDGNDDMSDVDSINIEEIENSIMNKLDSMIDDKLNKSRLENNKGTNESTEPIENPIEEDKTENESNTNL